MGAYIVGMGNHLYQQSLLFKVSHNGFPGFIAVHALIGSLRAYRGIII